MHGDRQLYSDLDLVIAPVGVTGLAGVNSAGKSTLLQMLAGARAPDAGTVTISPPTATIGYLPQQPDRRPEEAASHADPGTTMRSARGCAACHRLCERTP